MSAYRRDIDGLRAVAIIPVVLYHYGVGPLNGGYVGVDVFFVLSGFLITSILLADMEAKRFSLFGFYERRFRRILPALFCVILAVELAGFSLLPPRALEELSKSIVATVTFSSNMYFWVANTGYFAGPAETRPLLHTWSLAVEEQFYIVFPIFLAALLRLGRSRAGWVVAGLACVSLVLSVWAGANAPTANFYIAPTRAWELLLGAGLALYPVGTKSVERWLAEIFCIVGLLLISFSVFAFGPSTPVPGLPALAPCLGVALLVYGGNNPKAFVARLLSTPALVGIGLISYPLYLWHWPIYVFARHYILFAPLDALQVTVAIAASVILATLSWRFVEQPVRSKKVLVSRRAVFLWAAAATTLFLGLGAVGALAGGFPGRFQNLAAVAMQVEEPLPIGPRAEQCFTLSPGLWGREACQLTSGEARGRRVLLWGDSFAAHYASGFLVRRASLPFSVLQYTAPRCPPVLAYHQVSNGECEQFNRRVLEIIPEFGIDTVVLSARWESYLESRKLALNELTQTIAVLRERGLNVVLIGQSPTFYFSYPDDFLLAQVRAGLSPQTARATAAFDPMINERLRRAAQGATFFDPATPLCQNGSCLFRENGLYLVADSGHFTRYGSERMVDRLAQLPVLRGPRAQAPGPPGQ